MRNYCLLPICQTVRAQGLWRSIGRVNPSNTHAQKEEDDQTLSNSSVSLSEKPQSGAAEAIRVNGFAEELSGFSYKNMKVESIICSASQKKKKKKC